MSIQLKIKSDCRLHSLSTLSLSPEYSPFKGVGGSFVLVIVSLVAHLGRHNVLQVFQCFSLYIEPFR